MSDGSNSIAIMMAGMSAINVVSAVIILRRPHARAEANRAFIESGQETHFEQRRAWATYGTAPETDPDRLKRNAYRMLWLNVLAIAAVGALGWLS